MTIKDYNTLIEKAPVDGETKKGLPKRGKADMGNAIIVGRLVEMDNKEENFHKYYFDDGTGILKARLNTTYNKNSTVEYR